MASFKQGGQSINLRKGGLPFVVVGTVAIVGAGLILALAVDAQVGEVVVSPVPVHVVDQFVSGQRAPEMLGHDKAMFLQSAPATIHGIEEPIVSGVNGRAGQDDVSLGVGPFQCGMASLAILHSATALAIAGEAALSHLRPDSSRENVAPPLAYLAGDHHNSHALSVALLNSKIRPVNGLVRHLPADPIASRLADEPILVASARKGTRLDSRRDLGGVSWSDHLTHFAPNVNNALAISASPDSGPVNCRMRRIVATFEALCHAPIIAQSGGITL